MCIQYIKIKIVDFSTSCTNTLDMPTATSRRDKILLTQPSSMAIEVKRCRKRIQPNRFLITTFTASLLLLAIEGCSAFVSLRNLQQGSPASCILQMVVSSPPPSSAASDSSEEQDGVARKCKFMYMTEEEDRLLKEQGDLEESLMQTPSAITAADLPSLLKKRASSAKRAGGGSGGFGGGGFGGGTKKGVGKKKKKKPPKKTEAAKPSLETESSASPEVQALTEIIREEGLVRIDNVLSGDKADELRDYLIDLRKRAKEDVETGEIEDSQQRFADVLLNQNRCDLKIPLGPKPVHEALLDVLNGSENEGGSNVASPTLVRQVIEGVFDHYGSPNNPTGSQASLWELNCFMSNSGARRQLVHADCVCLDAIPGLDHTDTNSPSDPPGEPILLTCFIALQDIDPSMGPTVFMPKTHNIRSHNVFFETGRDSDSTKTETFSPKNELLCASKSIVGAPIPKGSCIIFDPRVLHCAGANQCFDLDKTRALFYMTFKNPKVDSPGCPSTSGYGIANAELTMNELISDLLWMERGADEATAARRVPLMAASP